MVYPSSAAACGKRDKEGTHKRKKKKKCGSFEFAPQFAASYISVVLHVKPGLPRYGVFFIFEAKDLVTMTT